MSFRLPKGTKKKQKISTLNSVSSPFASAIHPASCPLPTHPTSEHLIASSTAPQSRRARHAKGIFISGAAQNILSLPGQEYMQLPSSRAGHNPASHPNDELSPTTPAPTPDLRRNPAADLHGPSNDFNIMDDMFISLRVEPEGLRRQRQKHKNEKRWKKWTEEVIPSLLRPHLHLLRESETLRSTPQLTNQQCSCHAPSRRLKVVCVYFERECDLLILVIISSALVCGLIVGHFSFALHGGFGGFESDIQHFLIIVTFRIRNY
jgi:hypothetical protein